MSLNIFSLGGFGKGVYRQALFVILVDMTRSQQYPNLSQLQTESVNLRAYSSSDPLNTISLCTAFNQEEAKVARAVSGSLPDIASLIDDLVPRLRQGGRLVYIGAGNSGRLAWMDSSELPATFSVDPSQFLAVVAGGREAIIQAVEEAEDSEADGFEKLQTLRLTPQDTVVGISASGRTPFVLGGFKSALMSGALTAAITNVHPSELGRLGLNYCISTVVGPEFIAGSTRLKAGSSAKQIINMISTCAMIKMGKTWRGLMIDVRVKNNKLRARGRKILRQVCERAASLDFRSENMSPPFFQPLVIPDTPEGDAILDSLIAVCGNSVKLAVAVVLSGLDPDAAQKQLKLANDDLAMFVQALSSRAFKSSRPPVVSDDHDEYFVAIDGGGTNCTVCIATRSGIVARGTSGPCNFNCVTLEQLVYQIASAKANALMQAPDGNFSRYSGIPRFRKVWAGIAGLHHAYQLESLTDRLEELFDISSSERDLYLTSDSMLPSACIGDDKTVEGGISVIAGTGSVATAFRRDSTGQVIQVGRAGGWGHLIGDQGSAFDIGKRALQAALISSEQRQGEGGCEHNHDHDLELTELETRILDRIRCEDGGELLSSILFHSSREPKLQVADLARIVTELGFREKNPDVQSLAILKSAAHSLAEIIAPLTKKSVCDPSTSILVLSGALMDLPAYRSLLLDSLASLQPVRFKKTVSLQDTAGCAAQFLARRASF